MAQEKLEIIISAKDQTRGVLGNLKSGLSGLGRFAATAAAVGIGAVATGVGALGVATIKFAKDAAVLGPIAESFENIAEASGKSSQEVLKAFQEQSRGMITNTELMKSYNLAASLVGDQFANELPEALGMVGKVAAATGEDMGFLMDSLVRGVGRLSPLILDNLGIQVDLTQAYEDWAEANGKAVSEMTKTEQQIALMNQVMQKLGENTAALPEFDDPFKRLSVTFQNLKDTVAKTIGPVVLPLISDLADSISNFVASDDFQQWLQSAADWIRNSLVPAVKDLFKWLGDNLPPVISFISQLFSSVLIPAFRAVYDFIVANVVPAIRDIFAWIGERLPPVIAFLATVWNNVLLPALRWVWDFIQNYTIPAWKAIFEWIGARLPPVITFLSNLWSTVLLPALQVIYDFIITNVVPAIQTLIQWIGQHLPPVIAFLSQIWSTVLLPALQAVWNFITNFVIPGWMIIFDILGTVIPPIIQFMASLWNNVLKPALEAVYNFVVKYVVPGFRIMVQSIQAVINIIKTVIGWIGALGNKLKSIKLPSWLTPGSPTPFEMGLRGIALAMQEVAQSTNFLGNGIELKGAAGLSNQSAAVPAMAGMTNGGSPLVINLTYSPAVSLGNREEIDSILGPYVEKTLRRYRRG